MVCVLSILLKGQRSSNRLFFQNSHTQTQGIFWCFGELKNRLSCTGYASGSTELLKAQPSKLPSPRHLQPHNAEPEAADRGDSVGEQLVLTGLTIEGAANTLCKHALFLLPIK